MYLNLTFKVPKIIGIFQWNISISKIVFETLCFLKWYLIDGMYVWKSVEVKSKEYLFFLLIFIAQIYSLYLRKIRIILFALGLVTSSFALVIRYLSTLASFSSNCNTYLLNTCSYVIDFITKVIGSWISKLWRNRILEDMIF